MQAAGISIGRAFTNACRSLLHLAWGPASQAWRRVEGEMRHGSPGSSQLLYRLHSSCTDKHLSPRRPRKGRVTLLLELAPCCLRRGAQARRPGGCRGREKRRGGRRAGRVVNLALPAHQSAAAVARGAGAAFFSSLPSPRLISGYSAAL